MSRVSMPVEGLAAGFEPDAAWAAGPFAVIDFETTGLSSENDRVVEVGVACFRDGKLSALEDWVVNPGVPISDEARAVHNISDEEIEAALPFSAMVPKLASLLEGHIPVAYNASFDRGFLLAELARAGVAGRFSSVPAFNPKVVWIDPLVWSRELFRDEKSHRLGDVCARLGIANERAHRAASDSEASGHVLLAFAERMPPKYGDLVRLQEQSAARQDVDFSGRRR